MIVYELACQAGGHRFEGWFASSEDYDSQQRRGLVNCPHCGDGEVTKAPMAPRLNRKGNQLAVPVAAPATPAPALAAMAGPALPALPPAAREALAKLALLQAEALKTSRWVGRSFAEDARAMHYGERETEIIHGQASRDEAEALLEEGIAVAPLLIPVAPPEELN